MPTETAPDAGRRLIWAASLIVAVGAAAATAHGLYEVAIAASVPAGIAWLYPLITDGLALVAYAATTRLAGGGRRYAWAVVVLAAGLSGLAQASYLAYGAQAAPIRLRFGVGAWPAVAAAVVAHLLYLLGPQRPASHTAPAVRPSNGTGDAGQLGAQSEGWLYATSYDEAGVHRGTAGPVNDDVRADVRAYHAAGVHPTPAGAMNSAVHPAGHPRDDPGADSQHDVSAEGDPTEQAATTSALPAVEADPRVGSNHGAASAQAGAAHRRADDPVQPVVQPSDAAMDASGCMSYNATTAVQPQGRGPVGVEHPSVQPDPGSHGPGRTPYTLNTGVEQDERTAVQPVAPGELADPAGGVAPVRDRARAAARSHHTTHGALPTVSELMAAANVARGTAGAVLKELRAQRPGLHVVNGPPQTRSDR